MKRHPMRKRNRRRQRGSALLVTLMVMVGLSLLGLGFVAISETENTISANQRNYTQVLSVAEAGARVVVEWFQDPTWAATQHLMPPNTAAIKRTRTLSSGSPMGPYTGQYKDSPPDALLFDKPYKPAPVNRFLGDENHPDILINSTTAPAFLTSFNTALLKDTTDGQITEIRIFAPPIMSGTLNASGFWESGSRYGLCTIKVTAQKIIGSNPVATRFVKLVISEWPFPGPQGPVQSNANISTGGNFGVHWGRMTSDKTMEIKRPLVGLPWNDPWERIHFEHGYWEGCNDTAASNCAAVFPTLAPLGAGHGFDSNFNANTATFCDGSDWLYKLSEIAFEDPWYEARAKTQITNAILTGPLTTNPQPFQFTVPGAVITANGPSDYSGFSNWFQLQNIDDPVSVCGGRMHKLVIFPKIDYNFWKNLSQAASTSVSGAHYLRWVSGESYTDGVSTKTFAQWVNTARATAPAKSGFYFFDTQNGLNPQGAAPPGTLAPPIEVNSSDDGSIFKMMGFIYLNTQVFGTTGIRGPDAYYNFPGEPYRDIGYKPVCTTAAPPAEVMTPPGGVADHYCTAITVQGANNGQPDGQDLNGNQVYDVFLGQRSVIDPGGRPVNNEYYPVPWFPGCTPGFNGDPGANCSEPQEPFLNLVYPTTACCSGGGAPSLLTAKWEAPGSVTRLSKVKKADGSGLPVTCSATLLVPPTDKTGAPLPGPNVPDKNCTSNAYDRDGPLVLNFGTAPNSAAIMDGVLYNEGKYDTEGNATYFGSILIQGDIVGTGNPDVWFDEYLVKGGWQDKFTDLPRVYITSNQTDQ